MSASQGVTDLSEDERAGLKLIRETGGIHQSDFWKELDVSSRKGSRIVESLENAELIQREEAVRARGPAISNQQHAILTSHC